MAVIKYLTKATQAVEDSFWLAVRRDTDHHRWKSWGREHEAAAHITSASEKQGERNADTQITIPSLFSPEPELMGWCHSHSRWVLPSWKCPPRDVQRWDSWVSPNPGTLTIKINLWSVRIQKCLSSSCPRLNIEADFTVHSLNVY